MSPEDWDESEARKRQAKGLPPRGKCRYVGPPIADIARGMVVANRAEQTKEQAQAQPINLELPAPLESGLYAAKVVASRLELHCTRPKLYKDLLRGNSVFHKLNLGGGMYRESDVINLLKSRGEWREEPIKKRLTAAA